MSYWPPGKEPRMFFVALFGEEDPSETDTREGLYPTQKKMEGI
jgi:hypothetical protein